VQTFHLITLLGSVGGIKTARFQRMSFVDDYDKTLDAPFVESYVTSN
jgi:hypothetical protein